jgi:hypothetical protein
MPAAVNKLLPAFQRAAFLPQAQAVLAQTLKLKSKA